MHRNRRGYTLIELLIVVGILGLAGALLVPTLGDRGDFDVQAAVRHLAADLTFAQSDAVANQQHRRLVFIPDPEQEGQFRGWCIVKLPESQLGSPFDPETADYVTDPLSTGATDNRYIIDIVGDERFGEAFVASVDLDGGQPFITFDELGGSVTALGQPGSGGEIVIRGGAYSYRITIDGITGKISIANISDEPLELEVGGTVVPSP